LAIQNNAHVEVSPGSSADMRVSGEAVDDSAAPAKAAYMAARDLSFFKGLAGKPRVMKNLNSSLALAARSASTHSVKVQVGPYTFTPHGDQRAAHHTRDYPHAAAEQAAEQAALTAARNVAFYLGLTDNPLAAKLLLGTFATVSRLANAYNVFVRVGHLSFTPCDDFRAVDVTIPTSGGAADSSAAPEKATSTAAQSTHPRGVDSHLAVKALRPNSRIARLKAKKKVYRRRKRAREALDTSRVVLPVVGGDGGGAFESAVAAAAADAEAAAGGALAAAGGAVTAAFNVAVEAAAAKDAAAASLPKSGCSKDVEGEVIPCETSGGAESASGLTASETPDPTKRRRQPLRPKLVLDDDMLAVAPGRRKYERRGAGLTTGPSMVELERTRTKKQRDIARRSARDDKHCANDDMQLVQNAFEYTVAEAAADAEAAGGAVTAAFDAALEATAAKDAAAARAAAAADAAREAAAVDAALVAAAGAIAAAAVYAERAAAAVDAALVAAAVVDAEATAAKDAAAADAARAAVAVDAARAAAAVDAAWAVDAALVAAAGAIATAAVHAERAAAAVDAVLVAAAVVDVTAAAAADAAKAAAVVDDALVAAADAAHVAPCEKEIFDRALSYFKSGRLVSSKSGKMINARVHLFHNNGFLSVPSDCDFIHLSIPNRGLRLLSIHATGDDRAFEDLFDGLGDGYVV
jgi:hypothetical protein